MASGTYALSDPYAILGVARSATRSEIRTAYRGLVERYHPDRYHGNPLANLANERMVAINQAYDVLSDPARRAVFDQRGRRTQRAAPEPAPRLTRSPSGDSRFSSCRCCFAAAPASCARSPA